MPCRSDHMEPTAREQESMRVIGFLKEASLLPNSEDFGIYGDVEELDFHTTMLCKYCQTYDVTNHSLEMQIWWRDHQVADKRRVEEEINSTKRKTDRDELMNRLTEYERSLLGIE